MHGVTSMYHYNSDSFSAISLLTIGRKIAYIYCSYVNRIIDTDLFFVVITKVLNIRNYGFYTGEKYEI